MPVQDDDPALRFVRQSFQTLAQLQFLRREPFVTEFSHRPECGRLDEDERAGHEPPPSAGLVPKRCDQARQALIIVHPDRHSTAENPPGFDLFRDFHEQLRAGVGVRINEQEPIPSRRSRSGNAGTGDLIDGLKHHMRPCRARDVSSAVRRIVVADDQFVIPPAPAASLR